MNVVYVSGNLHKVKYFNKMVGLDIPHHSVDVEEIQSLDPAEVASAKAKEAYKILSRPVIVEDTFVVIKELGKLPGPFVKWFIEEISLQGMVQMVKTLPSQKAIAGAVICYYDGEELQIFKSHLNGKISSSILGEEGFGWNSIFIPEGEAKTLGEMDEPTFEKYYRLIKPFDQLRAFLDKL